LASYLGNLEDEKGKKALASFCLEIVIKISFKQFPKLSENRTCQTGE